MFENDLRVCLRGWPFFFGDCSGSSRRDLRSRRFRAGAFSPGSPARWPAARPPGRAPDREAGHGPSPSAVVLLQSSPGAARGFFRVSRRDGSSAKWRRASSGALGGHRAHPHSFITRPDPVGHRASAGGRLRLGRLIGKGCARHGARPPFASPPGAKRRPSRRRRPVARPAPREPRPSAPPGHFRRRRKSSTRHGRASGLGRRVGDKGRPQAGGKERQRRSQSCRLCRPQDKFQGSAASAETQACVTTPYALSLSGGHLDAVRRPMPQFLDLSCGNESGSLLTSGWNRDVNKRNWLTLGSFPQVRDAGSLTAAQRRDASLTLGPEGEGSPMLTMRMRTLANLFHGWNESVGNAGRSAPLLASWRLLHVRPQGLKGPPRRQMPQRFCVWGWRPRAAVLERLLAPCDSAVGDSGGAGGFVSPRRSPCRPMAAPRWRHDRHGRRGASAGASGGRPASSSKCVPGESHARGGRSWVFAAGRGFTARPPTAGRKVRGRRWRACHIAGGAVWLLAFTFVHSCSTFVNVRNS